MVTDFQKVQEYRIQKQRGFRYSFALGPTKQYMLAVPYTVPRYVMHNASAYYCVSGFNVTVHN
jgi:hypothetical protein